MNDKKNKKQKLVLKKNTILTQIEIKQKQLEEINKELENIEQMEIKNLLNEHEISFEDLQELLSNAKSHTTN